ncbi:uncharacterized protein KY384_002772 [Bacidia gigantensis]|uniref:uncharacterized protein n=1 Tax=Bacidia gigantensis TaxID=2732470 RepID=UPI001D05274A|nr:uncharacterized protein KY384_002772 [Bacidia gigantensis]KAG8532894.1 hypothetical protein KY384_002772 [Bacidia gigantensis]
MASTAPTINQADLESFSKHLKASTRILALCGAGLSAASGLPTFRGAGGLWRKHDATRLATPDAFSLNPSLVWHFYSYRRHMALEAKPNAAHYALAELARHKNEFLTLTQNVDGLSPRAGHKAEQIKYVHGSLFDVKCTSCDYKETDNFIDPIVPALAIPKAGPEPTPAATATSGAAATDSLTDALNQKELDISDETVKIADIPTQDLPQCPKCGTGLLRPGVVWFTEMLPRKVIREIDDYIEFSSKIDLMIVIGTSAAVYPAAGYIDEAREKGARVAVINMDKDTSEGLWHGDWFFEGDASVLLPVLFKDVIGDIDHMVNSQA